MPGFAVTLTVNVVVTLPEAGRLTCAGLKLQLMPEGSPPQPMVTDPPEPLGADSDKMKFAELPTGMVAKSLGDTAALTVPTLIVATCEWLIPALDPTTEKEYVPGASGAGNVTVMAAEPGACTDPKLAAHVAPAGNPAQVMLTGLLNPAIAATFTV